MSSTCKPPILCSQKSKSPCSKQEQQKQQKKEREAQGAASAASTKEGAAVKKGSKDGTLNKEDPDPHGAALAGHPDPLGEAAKLVRLLRENAADQLHTHNLAFEVWRHFCCPLMIIYAPCVCCNSTLPAKY